MRTLMISAAALALTAGIAAANPGIAQLAANAGVSPEGFTQAQLIELRQAQLDNDDARVRFILSQAGDAMTRSDMGAGVASSDAQLAATAGVEPGVYTTNELKRLIEAKRNNDTQTINFILSGESRADANPASVVTPGQAQMAAVLGVDPSNYTLAELSALFAEHVSDNRS